MNDINVALEELLATAPAVPVLTIEDAESAAPLAETLASAGLRVVEVTLRTDAALAAISAMRAAADDLIVGAGTVTDAASLAAAKSAGARFAVSPGATDALYRAAADGDVPLLPGVATASEILAGIEHGWRRFKFFPAEPAGGVAALAALAGPFPEVRFCPTGGIGAANAADYKRLPNVMTVGGSWMVPRGAVEAGDFERIGALARDCVNLLGEA